MDDTESLEGRAQRLLRQYESINQRDIPQRFGPLVDCLFGAIRQQIRLGREIDMMQLRGRLDIDVMVDAVNQTAIEH